MQLAARRTVGLLATLSLWLAPAAAPAFQQTEFRAADGTAYQVLLSPPPLGAGADRDRVTTIAGSVNAVGGCNQLANMPGSAVSAIAGVLPPGQVLHAFSAIQRTAILAPNDINTIAFDEVGGGHVTLGAGAGAINVCRVAANCPGGMSATLLGLATADAKVPAACIANGLQADCESGNTRNAIAFGLAASGNPPVCTTPANVTLNTTVCHAEPTDGFPIQASQAIVFVYDSSLAGLGFAIGAGGFGIDTDQKGSVCTGGGVVSAVARLDSNPGLAPSPPPRLAPLLSPVALGALAAMLSLWGMLRLRRRAH